MTKDVSGSDEIYPVVACHIVIVAKAPVQTSLPSWMRAMDRPGTSAFCNTPGMSLSRLAIACLAEGWFVGGRCAGDCCAGDCCAGDCCVEGRCAEDCCAAV